MTTENGLPLVKVVRQQINLLRDRMEYLQDKQAERIDDHLPMSHFIEAEVKALQWALPVLEAEYDNLVRLRRRIMEIEGRDPDRCGVDQGLFALNRHHSVAE